MNMIRAMTIIPVGISILTTVMLVFGVLILVGAVFLFVIYFAAKRQLTRFRSLLPASLIGKLTQDLVSGPFSREDQQPVSLSGMDRIYAPRIQNDFPELNLNELKRRAERLAFSTLAAIGNDDVGPLTEQHGLYTSQVNQYLERLRLQGQREQYQNITIHRVVLSDYQKNEGTCRIVFQLAIGARYRKTGMAQQTQAEQDALSQFRFELEALYVQDPDYADTPDSRSLALNCPNCGAPMRSLGEKQCPYCGSAVEPVNKNVWTFSRFQFQAG
ncbi:MAG: zinc ribbon domain-containing protein [Ruminococcaceae bacterium]|nr:zinc ribbon domain-containing protein [Oscillospiraceae bacterium]